MLKKTLIIAVGIAMAVSPLLPRAFADSGSAEWSTLSVDETWEYDQYHVAQLSLDATAGPYEYNDAVYFTRTSDRCQFQDSCDLLDISLLKGGDVLEVEGVLDLLVDDFAPLAQDGRFVFLSASDNEDSWGTIYEYDTDYGVLTALTDVERYENAIKFMAFGLDGDRLYFSTLQEDPETSDVESSLSVYDMVSGYSRDDFTYQLTAPWQELLDVHDGVALARFQFEGGFEQLWLIDQTARQMQEIPGTWTEEPGDIIGAHFADNGTVRYFRNYRLNYFDPSHDEMPREMGGAFLSWNVDAADAIQVAGTRMAFIDASNYLYVANEHDVKKYGLALNGNFTLEDDAIYFQNAEGDYVSYQFTTGKWETRPYHVTDRYDDVLVGVDAQGTVWYENLSKGTMFDVGYGSAPLLSDHYHAYWLGVDGDVYEVSFSPTLELARAASGAVRATDQADVYMIEDDQLWLIPDESTYFTWFDSWTDVLEVSTDQLDAYFDLYAYAGEVKMAPGTRLKSVSSPKLYIVGNDGELHWLKTEEVARALYGSAWNQGIVEVSDTYMWRYAKGSSVDSVEDAKQL